MKAQVDVRRRKPRLVQVVTALPVLLFGMFLSPIAVHAHALLVASSPAAGLQIDATVRRIMLTFDGPVEAGLSTIRVLDSNGAERSAGRPAHPLGALEKLVMPTTPLRHGQFVVAWRVVSADSHVARGAFAFGVGEAAGEVPLTLVHPPEFGLPLVLAVLHIGEIASLLTAVGLTIATIAIPRCQAPLAPIAQGAWIALSAIAFVQFFGQSEAIGVEPLRLLETRLGAPRVALVLGGVLGWVALRARSRALLTAATLIVIGGDVFSGHATTGVAPPLGIVIESIHLVGAAAWVGVLIGALGASAEELERVRAVAAGSVLALTLTAIPQAWRNIATPSALGTTVYGRFVCAKAGLFVCALGAAAVSHRRSRRRTVPIGTSIKIELAILAGLTLVTGLLVDTTPPRLSTIQAAQTMLGTFRVADRRIDVSLASASEREYLVQIMTIRDAAGPNDVDELRAWIRDREHGVGPLTIALQRRGAGLYCGRIAPPFPGHWQLLVRARIGEFEEGQHVFRLR